jgi:catechol-2,3-dioxygenase
MTFPSPGVLNVKVVAISVVSERANQFYTKTLGLAPAYQDSQQIGYLLGETILMFSRSAA